MNFWVTSKLLVRGAHAELGPGGECGGASRGGTVARSAGVADGPDPPACRAGGAQNAQRARGAIRTDFRVLWGKATLEGSGAKPLVSDRKRSPDGKGPCPPPTGLLATELDWLMANLGLKKKGKKKKTAHEISLCKNSHRHQPLARAVWQARVIPRGDPARGLRSRSAGRDTWESSGLCGRCRSSHRVPGDGRLAGARGQGCASLR